MAYFKTADLSIKDTKKLLIGSVIPRPIALVTSQSPQGIINIAPFSYFNVVSYDPPLVSISILRQGGKSKDTAKNILTSKEAVIQFVTEANLEMANRAAIDFDYNESELEFTGFQLVDSQLVAVPGLAESPIRFEVSLFDHILIHKEDEVISDLILLQVEGVFVDESIYDADNHYIKAEAFKAVSRLAGDDYAGLGEIFSLKRPKRENE